MEKRSSMKNSGLGELFKTTEIRAKLDEISTQREASEQRILDGASDIEGLQREVANAQDQAYTHIVMNNSNSDIEKSHIDVTRSSADIELTHIDVRNNFDAANHINAKEQHIGEYAKSRAFGKTQAFDQTQAHNIRRNFAEFGRCGFGDGDLHYAVCAGQRLCCGRL